MKRSVFVLLSLWSGFMYAQKPVTVYSIAKEMHEVSWYEEQQRLWKEEIRKNKSDANAWYNYYYATRGLKNLVFSESNREKQQQLRNKYTEECKKIVEDTYKAVPNSFEANHMKFLDSGNDPASYKYLDKAVQINPNDARAFSDMMIRYQLEQDEKAFSEYCSKMYKANELPASILNWGYNLLSELDQNAVVFTAGDNDTYAAWIVQQQKNFRKDVTVINTSLFMNDVYRDRLLSKLKLPVLSVSMDKRAENKEIYDEQVKKIYAHLFKNTKNIPVYVASTAIFTFEAEKEVNDHLYMTGLAYKYSEQEFDNTAVIRRNIEKRYLLDYLKEYFSYNKMDAIASQMDALYANPLIKLYKMYEIEENESRKQEVYRMLTIIGKKAGIETEIMNLLDR